MFPNQQEVSTDIPSRTDDITLSHLNKVALILLMGNIMLNHSHMDNPMPTPAPPGNQATVANRYRQVILQRLRLVVHMVKLILNP